MTVTGVTDCAILAILRSSSISRNAIDKHSISVTPFGLRALPLLRVSLAAPAPVPVPVPAPVSAPWASWAPPEACCCGAAGAVSGPFGRSSRVQHPISAACGYPPRGWQLLPLRQGQSLPLQTTHLQTLGQDPGSSGIVVGFLWRS
jgi:hypothetical protein